VLFTPFVLRILGTVCSNRTMRCFNNRVIGLASSAFSSCCILGTLGASPAYYYCRSLGGPCLNLINRSFGDS
jgi:hypothetical protein